MHNKNKIFLSNLYTIFLTYLRDTSHTWTEAAVYNRSFLLAIDNAAGTTSIDVVDFVCRFCLSLDGVCSERSSLRCRGGRRLLFSA